MCWVVWGRVGVIGRSRAGWAQPGMDCNVMQLSEYMANLIREYRRIEIEKRKCSLVSPMQYC